MISIAAVGDIMLGDHPVCYGHGVRSTVERLGLAHLMGDVAPTLHNHDIAIGNLECVLSDYGQIPGHLDTQEIRGRPEYAHGLASAGLNILSVANNHILQHGRTAFDETVAALQRNGIATIGRIGRSGGTEPYATRVNGLGIAFLGFSLRPEQYASINDCYAQPAICELLAEVRSARQKHQLVAVSLHWGDEYLHQPSAEQVTLAREIVDNGAILVIGHHPHVIQPIEEYRGSLIAYSLGNFVFDSWIEECKASMILSVNLSENGISSWDCIPLHLSDEYKPTLLVGEEYKAAIANISSMNSAWMRKCDSLVTHCASYRDMARYAERDYRIQSYTYFARRFYMYKPWVIRQSLLRAVRRRFQS